MPTNENKIVVIGDTNAAYKLYFFAQKNVIRTSPIEIQSIGTVVFHQVVLEEVSAHIESWMYLNKVGIRPPEGEYPNFFDVIGEEELSKIEKFVTDNLSQDFAPVDSDQPKFQIKRKIYERERKKIQAQWQKSGTKGRKTYSTPSNADYGILYTAETTKTKIVTNDEILLAVAEDILGEGNTYKTEDLINAVLREDPSKKAAIQEALTNLEFMGEHINVGRVLNSS